MYLYRYIIIISWLLSCALASAQALADFENFDLPQDSFLNQTAGNIGFQSGHVLLPNSYNIDFNSWTGWAISNMKDDTTPGFQNQYSAITKAGANGSNNYAVSFSSAPNTILLQGDASGRPVPGLYITNATYPFLSMRDGDAFAKRFGGISGDDPDFFLLTIKYFSGGVLAEDSIDFYLADFRFSDNSLDYIVDTWTYVDLSSFGDVDSLWFLLSSSDVGMFGMNTPAYFCIDDLTTAGETTMNLNQNSSAIQLFPNPASDALKIRFHGAQAWYQILDLRGTRIQEGHLQSGSDIEISGLEVGLYQLRMLQSETVTTKSFLKL